MIIEDLNKIIEINNKNNDKIKYINNENNYRL